MKNRGRSSRLAVLAILLTASGCGPKGSTSLVPVEGSTSLVPVGGYQQFAGALEDGTIFKGRAWLRSSTGERGFCAEVGAVKCVASYYGGPATIDSPQKFRCTDGREGIAKPVREKINGKPYSYAALVEMTDGTEGFVSISPVRVWYGEELCAE